MTQNAHSSARFSSHLSILPCCCAIPEKCHEDHTTHPKRAPRSDSPSPPKTKQKSPVYPPSNTTRFLLFPSFPRSLPRFPYISRVPTCCLLYFLLAPSPPTPFLLPALRPAYLPLTVSPTPVLLLSTLFSGFHFCLCVCRRHITPVSAIHPIHPIQLHLYSIHAHA
jgi:hypothetical protein